MTDLTPFLILLLVAVVVVIAAQRLKVPYTVVLVVLGFALGLIVERVAVPSLSTSVRSLLSPGTFFDILLPPIVFEAAIQVNSRFLRARAPLILFLVFVGVLFTTIFTGYLVSYVAAIPLTAALLIAAILSPTDPVAVIDLFRRLRVPRELSTIVETESLLNDAVGIIMFVIFLGFAEQGSIQIPHAIGQFFWLVFGGAAVGLVAAVGVSLLHRRLNDPAVETALSVVVAYGSYLLAVDIGASGIVATAIAGIAIGTWVAPRAMEPDVRNAVTTFWSVVVYIANSVIFLSMGLVFALTSLVNYVPLIAIVFAVVFLGRAIFVYAHRPLARAFGARDRELPTSWYNVIALGGIRGAIPIVLALSLLTTPTVLSSGTIQEIVAAVLGVVFASMIGGNIVVERYARRQFTTPDTPEPEA